MDLLVARSSAFLALGLVACDSAVSRSADPDAAAEMSPSLAVTTGGTYILRAGTEIEVPVEVVREGAWQGDVEVSIAGLPAGASASALTLAADESQGVLLLSATEGMAPGLRGSMELLVSGGGLTASTDAALLTIGDAGELDTSFGGPNGAATSLANGFDVGTDVLALPDGSVLVGGTDSIAGGYTVLHRRRPDGSLDPSFGDGGVVRIESADEHPCDLDLLPDGRVLVYLQEEDTGRVLALLPDGSIDQTLDVDALEACEEDGLLVQSDGAIVIVGTSDLGMAVERRLSSGAHDPDFGVDGRLELDLAGVALGHLNWPVALEDGKVLIAARFVHESDWRTGLLRITAGGAVDTAYGTGGLLFLGGENGSMRGLLRESSDRLLPVHFDGTSTTTLSWVDARGRLLQPPASKSFDQEGDWPYDTAMDGAGRSYALYSVDGLCFVLRHTSTGALDPSFGEGGIATVEVPHDGSCHGLDLEDGVRAVLTGWDREAPAGEHRTWVAQIWL